MKDVIKTVRWDNPPSSSVTEKISTAAANTSGAQNNAMGLDRLKKAFLSELPLFMEGKTIAQTMANLDRHAETPRRGVTSKGVSPRDEQNTWTVERSPYGSFARIKTKPLPLFRVNSARPTLNPSERVVQSHLRYLNEFEPFKKGLFSKSTLYEFIFYMIVENGRRECYTKRVIKSVMAYLKAYGAQSDLPEESWDYIKNFRNMGGVKFSTFYRRMDALTNALGDDQTKRLLSAARHKRALVFNDDEESRILQYCVSVLRATVKKYLPGKTNKFQQPRSSDSDWHCVDDQREINLKTEINTNVTAADTRASRVNYERTIFEFAFAYVIGFLSGARIRSTVLKLSVDDVKTLLKGGRLEVLTKGAFVNVFLPTTILEKESDVYSNIMELRKSSLLYENMSMGKINLNAESESENKDGRTEQPVRFFTRSPRQLELMLDRVYKSRFVNKTRTTGVRWHSQRRRYLGVVNSKYGMTAASESVGHKDISTTMIYINNSMHMDDVRLKASDAITERYGNLLNLPD